VIREDAWYIIPEKEIRGLKSISLCTVGGEARYEQFREAWGLLRKASAIGDAEDGAEQPAAAESAVHPSSAVGRMETAANYFMRYLHRSNVIPPKNGEG
jgi:hypothetical protein